MLSSTIQRNDYTGNGAVKIYGYDYRIFLESDLVVIVADLVGAETTLVLNTDYSVDGVGDDTGDITLIDASQAWLTAGFLTTDYTLVVKRIRPITQLTDIRNQGDFFAERHENEYDNSRMIDQQLQEQIDRALTLSATTSSTVSAVLPSPEADAPLGWAADGLSIVNNPTNAFQVRVDSGASQGFLGTDGSDGVLRTGSNISMVDGGDFTTMDVVASPTFTGLTLTTLTLGGFLVNGIIDDDSMATASATVLSTSESIKAYVDAQIVAQDEFTELTDTPANYVGSGGFIVRVNPGATALVFGAESAIDHDGLTNFVANEHIDHTSVTLTAGAGLTGGGDISANRTFAVGAGSFITVNANDIAVNEAALTHDNLIAGTIVSHDTTATGANLTTLTDGSNADALHTHAAAGFADPMTTRGDMIYRDATNTTVRLPVGGAGEILGSDGTDVAWIVAGVGTDELVKIDIVATAGYIGALSSDGVLRTGALMSYVDGGDFVTLNVNESALTHDNLIAGTIASHDTTATGANLTTLTDGSNADALHVHADVGFADPMTTRGDIIIRDATNTTARLGIGANTFVLTSDGTDISWTSSAGGGGNTLDAAYDQGGAGLGRTITVDTGVVQLTSSAGALGITDSGTTTNSIDIVANLLSSGSAINIASSSTDTGSRNLLRIDQSSAPASGTQRAIYISNASDSKNVLFDAAGCTTQNNFTTASSGLTTGTGNYFLSTGTALTSAKLVYIQHAGNTSAFTGNLLRVESSNTDTTVKDVVVFQNASGVASGTVVLKVAQAGAGAQIVGQGNENLSNAGVWTNRTSTYADKEDIAEIITPQFIDKLKALKLFDYKKKVEIYGQQVDTEALAPDGKKIKEYPKTKKKNNADARLYKGFILDDASTPEDLISRDYDGNMDGISPELGVNFLLGVVKELITRVETLEAV